MNEEAYRAAPAFLETDVELMDSSKQVLAHVEEYEPISADGILSRHFLVIRERARNGPRSACF
jgi:hypothetical protein